MRRLFPLLFLAIVLFFGGTSVYFASAAVSHTDLLIYDGKALSLVSSDGINKKQIVQTKVALSYWSPDGETIAYLVKGGVYLTPRSPIKPYLLTSKFNADNVSRMQWMPNSTQIMIEDGTGKLHYVDVSTKRVKTVTGTTGIWFPTVSPDGTRIAYGTTKNGLNSSVFVADMDGKNARPLVSNLPNKDNTLPRWSPDGGTIAFYASGKLGLFEVSKGTIRYQTIGKKITGEITWSPDSKMMAFVYEDAKSRLLLWSIADGSGKIIRSFDDKMYFRGWSPDGKEILYAFTTTRSGKTTRTLGLMNVADGKQRSVTAGEWGTFATAPLTGGLNLEAGVKRAWAVVGRYCAAALGIVSVLWVFSATAASYRRMTPDQRRTAAIIGGAALLGAASAISSASAASAKRQKEERERAERAARANAQLQRQNAASQPSQYQRPQEDDDERAARLEALQERNRAQQRAQAEAQRRFEQEQENERWKAQQRRDEDTRRWSEAKNQEARDRGESTTY